MCLGMVTISNEHMLKTLIPQIKHPITTSLKNDDASKSSISSHRSEVKQPAFHLPNVDQNLLNLNQFLLRVTRNNW